MPRSARSLRRTRQVRGQRRRYHQPRLRYWHRARAPAPSLQPPRSGVSCRARPFCARRPRRRQTSAILLLFRRTIRSRAVGSETAKSKPSSVESEKVHAESAAAAPSVEQPKAAVGASEKPDRDGHETVEAKVADEAERRLRPSPVPAETKTERPQIRRCAACRTSRRRSQGAARSRET